MEEAVKTKFEAFDAEFNRINHRLSKVEETQNAINDLAMSVKELSINSKYTAEKVETLSADVKAIKEEPLNTVKSAKSTALNSVVGFVVGAILTALAWLVATHGGI